MGISTFAPQEDEYMAWWDAEWKRVYPIALDHLITWLLNADKLPIDTHWRQQFFADACLEGELTFGHITNFEIDERLWEYSNGLTAIGFDKDDNESTSTAWTIAVMGAIAQAKLLKTPPLPDSKEQS